MERNDIWMEHARALIIKFVMIFAVLLIVLGLFYGVSFANIFWTSLILTVAAYLIGDLFILPMSNNITATLCDLGLAFLGIWLIGSYMYPVDVPVALAAIISALVIMAGEWFFHRYMENQVLEQGEEA